jgi:hypothetical protein
MGDDFLPISLIVLTLFWMCVDNEGVIQRYCGEMPHKCGDFFSSKEGLRRLSICEAVLRQGGSFAMSGWSRRGDLNPRPSDYESLALPLSYAGIKF